jgi:hypothetical protein
MVPKTLVGRHSRCLHIDFANRLARFTTEVGLYDTTSGFQLSDTTSHSIESVVVAEPRSNSHERNLASKACRGMSGDWSQSGVEPPHSEVADDWHSIVKEQSRSAGFRLGFFRVAMPRCVRAGWHPDWWCSCAILSVRRSIPYFGYLGHFVEGCCHDERGRIVMVRR